MKYVMMHAYCRGLAPRVCTTGAVLAFQHVALGCAVLSSDDAGSSVEIVVTHPLLEQNR
jgi:hypothetical protein